MRKCLEESALKLKEEIINQLISISKKYKNINKVVLFGSRARGDNDPRSDIDLAIYSDGHIIDFIEEVENCTNTLLEFDFSDMSRDKDMLFLEQIDKEGIVLYEKC